ncbi:MULTISPECIES: hypothetical protein [Pseudalkalibacillus]|uniref:hypothetical protein n=1 Tax=Pseudalkalibacillus TaxID=2893058 RepID=UPI001CD24A62|nr:hypothetical protein [Pseudalkalibacillus salsuginis]MCF6408671.1 hypothetical protein [Pseudalkalibacillus salsuginis]
MRKRRGFNKYRFQYHLRQFRSICEQFVFPLLIFQAIRTLLFPSAFDIILVVILLALHLAIYYEFW